jgi:hypothetical protein
MAEMSEAMRQIIEKRDQDRKALDEQIEARKAQLEADRENQWKN